MSFAGWQKRSKLYLGFIGRSKREGMGLKECCQAAYKAGERDGLKRGEELAKRAIELGELMRSNAEVRGFPNETPKQEQ